MKTSLWLLIHIDLQYKSVNTSQILLITNPNYLYRATRPEE